MVYTHHSFIACDDCGQRHYPGNKDACIEALQFQMEKMRADIRENVVKLINVVRMPNSEYVADAHNEALEFLRKNYT